MYAATGSDFRWLNVHWLAAHTEPVRNADNALVPKYGRRRTTRALCGGRSWRADELKRRNDEGIMVDHAVSVASE